MLCHSCPSNPVEGGIPSSPHGTKEACISQNKEQPGTVQSMYCKELVFRDDKEFSFEELRAQRCYKQFNGMCQKHILLYILYCVILGLYAELATNA